jgi:hypothetical protein
MYQLAMQWSKYIAHGGSSALLNVVVDEPRSWLLSES